MPSSTEQNHQVNSQQKESPGEQIKARSEPEGSSKFQPLGSALSRQSFGPSVQGFFRLFLYFMEKRAAGVSLAEAWPVIEKECCSIFGVIEKECCGVSLVEAWPVTEKMK